MKQYPIDVSRIEFLLEETNTYYKIVDISGTLYALWKYFKEETCLADNQNELHFLRHLLKTTELRVTEPIMKWNGEGIATVADPNGGEIKRCALFQWLPGEPLGKAISPAYTYQHGQMVAKLHLSAESLDIRTLNTNKKWDRVFYYVKEPVVYKKER